MIPFLDVQLLYPETFPAPLTGESWDDRTYEWNETPAGRFQLGGAIDAGVLKIPGGALLVGARTHVFRQSWDVLWDPVLLSTDTQVRIGGRWDTCRMRADAAVCLWYQAALGAHLYTVHVDGWGTQAFKGFGASTGLGLSLGKGHARGVVALDLDSTLGFGSAWGSVSGLDDEGFSWSYGAGGFTLAASAGVELR